MSVNGILIHTGKGGRGRVEPERQLEGQQFTKPDKKYYLDDCISSLHINSDKYLPESRFTGKFFR
jgi:hypothetical protein